MLSLRTLARAAPRTAVAARFAAAPAAARRCQPLVAAAARLQSQQTVAAAAFSTARVLRAASSKTEVDKELLAKLDSEIKFETEIRENEPEATSVKDFIESGLFEIEDVPGREDVVLRRTYGNEKISVTFSVADLSNYDPEVYDEDAALADEDGEGEGGHKNEAAAAEAEEAEEDLESAAVPVRLTIVIEKPGQGAINVEATAQDGALLIDNLYYYKDAALAHETSSEAAFQAQSVYPGPAFGSLDEDLQVQLDRYLEERGITQALAVFAPEYLDAKEQREYLGFLQNLKTFIDA